MISMSRSSARLLPLIVLVLYLTFTNAQVLSQARFSFLAAASGNKFVFAGGRLAFAGTVVTTVDIYDVNTNQWNSTSTGAGSLSVARYGAAAAGTTGIIIFAGGYAFFNTVDMYDTSTGIWNSSATGAGQLSVARDSHTAAAAGTKIVFAGGTYEPHGNGTNVVTVDIYDVITKTWNSTTTGAGQISLARRYMAAASAGTKMVFAGGIAGSYVSTVDIYDVSTGLWTATGSLSVARFAMGAAAAGNIVVFAGGNNGGYLNTVDIYDVSTGVWNSTAGQLSVARDNVVAAAANNKLVFAGGGTGGSNYKATVDIFDIGTGQWSTSLNLSVARIYFAGAGLADKVVFGGGYNDTPLATVDIFTIAPSTTVPTSTMTTAPSTSLPPLTLNVAQSDPILIDSNVTLTSVTLLLDDSSSIGFPIQVNGVVTVDSSTAIIIQLSSPLSNGSIVPILTAMAIDGQVSSITLIGDSRRCSSSTAKPLQSSTSLSALLLIETNCRSKLSSWKIALIVVIIIVVVCFICGGIAWYYWRKRKLQKKAVLASIYDASTNNS